MGESKKRVVSEGERLVLGLLAFLSHFAPSTAPSRLATLMIVLEKSLSANCDLHKGDSASKSANRCIVLLLRL